MKWFFFDWGWHSKDYNTLSVKNLLCVVGICRFNHPLWKNHGLSEINFDSFTIDKSNQVKISCSARATFIVLETRLDICQFTKSHACTSSFVLGIHTLRFGDFWSICPLCTFLYLSRRPPPLHTFYIHFSLPAPISHKRQRAFLFWSMTWFRTQICRKFDLPEAQRTV